VSPPETAERNDAPRDAQAHHPARPVDGCRGCVARDEALRAAWAERDALLADLARERERTVALLLGWPPDGGAAPLRGPLRHRIIDALNAGLKRIAPGAHRSARRMGEAAWRLVLRRMVP
jgi:transposase InsO family protein